MATPETESTNQPPGMSLEELEQVEDAQAAANLAGGVTTAQSEQPAEQGQQPEQQQEQPAEPDWVVPGQFRTADDVVRSYNEVRSYADRTAQENAQMRAAIAQMQTGAPQGQAPGQQEPGSPLEGLSNDELTELIYEDPKRYHAALLAEAEQRVLGTVVEQLGPYIGFAVQQANQSANTNALQNVEKLVGADVFARHQQAIRQYLDSDQDFFLDEATRVQRIALAAKAAEYDRIQNGGQAGAQPRPDLPPRDPQSGQFQRVAHMEGGSSQNPPQGAAGQQTDARFAVPEKAEFLGTPGSEEQPDIYGTRTRRSLPA